MVLGVLDVVLAAVGVLGTMVAALSGRLRRLLVSEPLPGLVAGVLLGPAVTGVLELPRWARRADPRAVGYRVNGAGRAPFPGGDRSVLTAVYQCGICIPLWYTLRHPGRVPVGAAAPSPTRSYRRAASPRPESGDLRTRPALVVAGGGPAYPLVG